ncbi:NicO-domain-containing protein [Thelephora ganbajun]|uniref:NicO-domain-containing protein n=1 Tax=Thelephora ganbajun TaxID=370292 RepID=A0ACB6ZP38_THEGA|nr:NicO-domain-containing protein [Thelephora ganbajun]
MWLLQRLRLPKFTIFGRSLLLITLELFTNVLFWVVAGILFGRDRNTRPALNLALLAWTLGLRHALDADHISAIDNATRGLINMGQLPVTCGLYFSLGHSTIVIIVNVAIAISTDIYDKLDKVGRVGGVVGAAISGSFLFIVGVANSIILYRIVKQRQRDRTQETNSTPTSPTAGDEEEPRVNGDHRSRSHRHGNTLLMKIIGPVITFVDRPWKMYPVGLLFGFGFDTASSIAILAISAIAKHGPDGKGIEPVHIIVLPLLFTAGMTLVDSLDSVLMLYSYTGFPERNFVLFVKRDEPDPPSSPRGTPLVGHEPGLDENRPEKINIRVKMNAMSGLSIILTLMSILVAFSISLITIMGLIGEECRPCRGAAEDEDNHSLAARWWRGWAQANKKSGYIGAAIVGAFLAVVLGWYGVRRVFRRRSGVQGSILSNSQ